MAAMYTANHYQCAAIVALTSSGKTPLIMSRIRTAIPIFAFSDSINTLRRMTLYRGVVPGYFEAKYNSSAEEISDTVKQKIKELITTKDQDKVLLTKGEVAGQKGGTNTLKILDF